MMNQMKKNMAQKIVGISKKITKTAVNKSVFIAAYEPDLSEAVKAFVTKQNGNDK